MKLQMSLLLAACCCMSSVWTLPTFNGAIGDRSLDEEWEMFKNSFNKKFDVQMESIRRLIWEDNLRYIQQHNLEADLGKHSHRLGMNHFGDLTHQEFKTTMLRYKQPSRKVATGNTYLPPLNVNAIPKKVDWREQGYVTPVKNQGQCGSCWAFSATGSLEGQWFRKTGKLISLSEKQVMDCGPLFTAGCEGGDKDSAFEYYEDFGCQSEKSYPYVPVDGNCTYNASQVVAWTRGYTTVTSGNEMDLQSAVAIEGPISVAIDASQPSFHFYQSGIYNEPNCSSSVLDHAVLAVGYGDGYWLVKNSWGPHWGDAGYIKMTRNKDNQCGIANAASYPVV